MSRIVYVNGSYLPEEEAKVSVFDRAFLFGDGVYEVTAVLDRRLVDFEPHLARLDRSLDEIALAAPLSHDGPARAASGAHRAERPRRRHRLSRDHPRERRPRFRLSRRPSPNVVAFTQSRPLIANPYAETGVKIVTIPDLRWKRRDIKSTSMLAQTMGKQEAKLKRRLRGLDGRGRHA